MSDVKHVRGRTWPPYTHSFYSFSNPTGFLKETSILTVWFPEDSKRIKDRNLLKNSQKMCYPEPQQFNYKRVNHV